MRMSTSRRRCSSGPAASVAYDSIVQRRGRAVRVPLRHAHRPSMPTPRSQVAPFTSLKVGFSHLGADYSTGLWERHRGERVPRVARHHRQPLFMLRGALREPRPQGRRLRGRSAGRSRRAARHAPLRRRRSRSPALHADRQRDARRHASASMPRPASAAMNTRTARTACSRTTRISTRPASRSRRTIATTCPRATDGRTTDRYSDRATRAAPPNRPIRCATGPPTTPARSTSSRPRSTSNGAIERTLIRLTADWNRSNDTYLYGLVTGSPLAVPEQLPPVKNELLRGEVDVTYEITRNLHVRRRLLVSTTTRSRTSRSDRRR